MGLNEMEKRLLFQVEGDYQFKVMNELYMTAQNTKNPASRKSAEKLMSKLRGLIYRRITVCPTRPGRLEKKLPRPGRNPARRN